MYSDYKLKLYDIVRDENFVPSLIEIKGIVIEDESDLCFNECNVVNTLNQNFSFNKCETEHVYVVSVNKEEEITGMINVAIGKDNRAEICLRAVIIYLVLIGARGFALYHNHPSNILMASESDIIMDGQFYALANQLNINYLGSYIVGRKSYIKIGENIIKEAI